MTVRVGINGFGRIGRNFFRAVVASGADIEIVAVNDLTDNKTLAHLLKYDSILGRFPGDVTYDDDVDHRRTARSSRSGPSGTRPSWTGSRVGADIVVESTGFFTDADEGQGAHRRRRQEGHHLGAGEQRRHHHRHGRQRRQVRRQPDDHLQRLLHHQLPRPDGQGPQRRPRHRQGPHDDHPRVHAGPEPAGRARTRTCAAPAPPPSTSCRPATGAAKAVALVLPELKGKLDGYALRVPTPTGSATDLTFEAGRETTVEEVNAIVKKAAEGPHEGQPRLHRGPDRLQGHRDRPGAPASSTPA